MILLTEKELEQLDYSYPGKFKSSHEVDMWVKHIVAKAQLKKMVDLLEQKTIKAYGGNRIILNEDWKAIQKEVE